MLDVDAAGAGARQIAHEVFERRRGLSRVLPQDVEELLGIRAQARVRELASVFLRLFREDDAPGRRYQPGFSEVLETGVFRPRRIDSRMRGMESR